MEKSHTYLPGAMHWVLFIYNILFKSCRKAIHKNSENDVSHSEGANSFKHIEGKIFRILSQNAAFICL